MNISVQAIRQPNGSYTLTVDEYTLFLIEKGLEAASKHRERARLNEAKKKGVAISRGSIPVLSIQRVETPVPTVFVPPVPIVMPPVPVISQKPERDFRLAPLTVSYNKPAPVMNIIPQSSVWNSQLASY